MNIKPFSRWATTLALLLLHFPTIGTAQNMAPEALMALRVDSLFAEWDKPTSPGCIVGVAREGELVFSKSYGMANLEYDMPIFKQTVFRVASISKQFTAACIILLEEKGELSLDDDVRLYLKDFPDYGTPITIRHLLHHTSGLRDFFSLASLAGYRDQDFFSEEQVMDLISQQKKLNYAPGDEILYNNSGYFLLAKIIEKISGKSMRDFAQEQIFKPLGMFRSHFHDNNQMVVKYRASGYRPRTDAPGFELYNTQLNITGDGGLFTTLEDLAKWDRNFYHNRLPISDFTAKMYKSGLLNDGTPTNYASGLDLGQYRGLQTVEHSGAFVGYRAHILRFPEPGLTIICLANLSTVPATRLAYQVADLYLEQHPSCQLEKTVAAGSLEQKKAVSIKPEVFGRYKGKYELSNGLVLDIFAEHHHFYIDIVGQTRFELHPEDNENFFVEDMDLELRFLPGDDGAFKMMLFKISDRVLLARRIEIMYQADAALLTQYEGKYYSEELGVYYYLQFENGQLFLRINDKPRKAVGVIRKDKMVFNDSMVRFQRDEAGKVEAFSLEAGPVRHLTFVKN